MQRAPSLLRKGLLRFQRGKDSCGFVTADARGPRTSTSQGVFSGTAGAHASHGGAVSRETVPSSFRRTVCHTEQNGCHSHHPSALPQGRGSATRGLRTHLFTSRAPAICRLPPSFTGVLVPAKPPSHVSRETKAHPFHTGLDRRSASYVLVDREVGPRHIQPRPHRRTHLRRGLLLIEGRTWC